MQKSQHPSPCFMSPFTFPKSMQDDFLSIEITWITITSISKFTFVFHILTMIFLCQNKMTHHPTWVLNLYEGMVPISHVVSWSRFDHSNKFFTFLCNVFHKCPLSFPPNILGQIEGELGYHRKVEMAIYWGLFLYLPPIPIQIMFWIPMHVGSQCRTLEFFPTLHIETYLRKSKFNMCSSQMVWNFVWYEISLAIDHCKHLHILWTIHLG